MEILLLAVTQNGAVYDRTNNRDRRLRINHPYTLGPATITLLVENGVIVAEAVNDRRELIYRTELQPLQSYTISPFFSHQLPYVRRDVRRLNRELRNVLKRMPFSLTEKTTIEQEFQIRLSLTNYRGIVQPTLDVTIHPEQYSEPIHFDEVVELVRDLLTLNFSKLFRSTARATDTMIVLPVDQHLIADAKTRENKHDMLRA